jgi:acetyl/propionyl-CoA carboxylase alpha subunit
MGAAAVVIGEAIRYCNAGTVEFILDQETRQFYFLEVNTRLQVEHPITEMITGLDLVELQIRVAEGGSLKELGVASGKVPRVGHAIECRLYCEDPNNNFMPSVGLLEWFKPPVEIAVRNEAENHTFRLPSTHSVVSLPTGEPIRFGRAIRFRDHRFLRSNG